MIGIIQGLCVAGITLTVSTVIALIFAKILWNWSIKDEQRRKIEYVQYLQAQEYLENKNNHKSP